MKIKIARSLMITALVSGCAGLDFKASNIDRLQPGKTTQIEAEILLGKPYARSTYQDGTQLYQWLYVSPLGAKHLAVQFDTKKRMMGVKHQSGF